MAMDFWNVRHRATPVYVDKVAYKIVGFDSGTGLLGVTSAKEHPEIWSNSQFPIVNKAQLAQQLGGRAEVIFGDVRDTVPANLGSALSVEAPLGFVALDVDTYTASADSLKIFLGPVPHYYLPAVPMYVDDINDLLTYNEWCGEELSIVEFNRISDSRKIQKKTARPSSEQKTVASPLLCILLPRSRF